MLEKFQVYIDPFQAERTIEVYMPKSYGQSDKSYPVLYMHDGQNVFRDQDAVGGVSLGLEDFLDETQFELIVVAIGGSTDKEVRKNEYCPWMNGDFARGMLHDDCRIGGLGKEYIEWIIDKLMPTIDEAYRTDQHSVTIGGISLGGLLSVYAAVRYPNIFSRCFGVSSAFFRNQEEMEHLINHSDLSSIKKIYLDCGTKEMSSDMEISRLFLESNERISRLLKNNSPHVEFHTIENAPHTYDAFKTRIDTVFSSLF